MMRSSIAAFCVDGLYNAAGFPREGPYGQEESDREEGIA